MGEWDVDAMLASMSLGQFQEWRAYFELEPWGSVREDLRAGRLCAIVGNSNPFRGKGKFFQPSDFFDTLKFVEKAQNQRDMATNLMARTKILDGEFKTISRK